MTGPGADPARISALLGPLAAPRAAAELAQSVVDIAQTLFRAKAASITELFPKERELEFVAVAGAGSAELPGTRFSADRGIAGWVMRARQPVTVEDVAADPRFARDVAESTGYVPSGLMAVPLLDEDDIPLGVLQVLDRPDHPAFGLAETQLLGLLGVQAVAALQFRRAGRRIAAAVAGDPADDRDPAVRALSELQLATEQVNDPAIRAAIAQAAAALTTLAAGHTAP